MFKLTAEREGQEPLELHANERYTREQAFTFCEGFVEAMGDTWPEGYDAVIRFSDGSAYMLADEWEELARLVKRPTPTEPIVEEFLGRKEGWRYTYVVTGTWPFPTDMLRYDQAEPATEADRLLIEKLSTENAENLDVLQRKSRVTLVGKQRPTARRWASFTWAVEDYHG